MSIASDAVYIVRPGNDNEELRYSLRSLSNLSFSGRVWFVGYVPSWVTGVLPIEGNRFDTKPRNVHDNVRQACLEPGVSETFILMNDDFFIVEPMVAVPNLHRGPLEKHIYNMLYATDWRASLVSALDWLKGRGIPDPLSYELHKPFEVDKAKMAEVLELSDGYTPDTPPQWRTIYGNHWQIGGERSLDKKMTAMGEWPPRARWVSTSDQGFSGPRARRIMGYFPSASPWESTF